MSARSSVFCFIKVNGSSKQLVGPRTPCLFRRLLFHEHQAILSTFRRPKILSLYFLVIKGPGSQPLMVNFSMMITF